MTDVGFTFSSSAAAQGGYVVMKLVGPLVLTTMFGFQSELTTNKPPVMIFDLTEVPYMDSAGVGVLINYYVSGQRNGRKMALAGANERLDALLVLTKVKELLRSYPTVEEALKKV
jgi:anti-anti-sigma factor